MIPGINISNVAAGRSDRSFQQLSLRGFGPSTSLSTLAATFIDGVPVASPTAVMGVTDPARVEILKGPPAAYFGRNTFSGAVSVVNIDPRRRFPCLGDADGRYARQPRLHGGLRGPAFQRQGRLPRHRPPVPEGRRVQEPGEPRRDARRPADAHLHRLARSQAHRQLFRQAVRASSRVSATARRTASRPVRWPPRRASSAADRGGRRRQALACFAPRNFATTSAHSSGFWSTMSTPPPSSSAYSKSGRILRATCACG